MAEQKLELETPGALTQKMEIDKRKLLETVRQFPCLWQPTYKEYKDLKAREAAWKAVAIQMGDPDIVEKCMVKWKSLRDRFVREIKRLRQEQTINPETTYTPPWSLFNDLLFLQHSVRHRSSNTGLEESFGEQSFDVGRPSIQGGTDVSVTAPSIIATDTRLQVTEPAIPATITEIPNLPPSPSGSTTSHDSNHSGLSPPQTKKIKSESSSSANDLLLKILTDVSSRERDSLDEEGLFGLQVAATLRRLTTKQKATAKIRIQQVLLEVEFPTET